MRDAAFRDTVEELRVEDEHSRAERAERGLFLLRLGQPESGWLFFGSGVVVPWNEMRSAYLAGCYQASLLVGQTCLENLLGGALEFPEGSVGTPGLAELLRLALDAGLLLEPEYRAFDALRRRRNPYAHYRRSLDPESTLSLARARDVPLEETARPDCERFLELMHAFAHRRFGCGRILLPPGLDDVEPAVHPDQMTLPETDW